MDQQLTPEFLHSVRIPCSGSGVYQIGHANAGEAVSSFRGLVTSSVWVENNATEFPQDPPHPLPQTSVHRLLSVFRAEHNVIFAVPFHVRLALPLSHVDLLSFELPGSLKGDRLPNAGSAEAFSSRTARGGGLPIGVNSAAGKSVHVGEKLT